MDQQHSLPRLHINSFSKPAPVDRQLARRGSNPRQSDSLAQGRTWRGLVTVLAAGDNESHPLGKGSAEPLRLRTRDFSVSPRAKRTVTHSCTHSFTHVKHGATQSTAQCARKHLSARSVGSHARRLTRPSPKRGIPLIRSSRTLRLSQHEFQVDGHVFFSGGERALSCSGRSLRGSGFPSPDRAQESNGGDSANQSGAPTPISENLLDSSGPASESADAYGYGYADGTVVVLGFYLGYHFLLSFLFRICSSHTLSLLVLSSHVLCAASSWWSVVGSDKVFHTC